MGSRLSLRISLTRSAIGWSSPNGPTRLGPSRTWKRPSRRRSPQVRTAKTPITRLARMSDLTSVTMKPSGIRSLRRCGGDRAGADVRDARRQAVDAGARHQLAIADDDRLRHRGGGHLGRGRGLPGSRTLAKRRALADARPREAGEGGPALGQVGERG